MTCAHCGNRIQRGSTWFMSFGIRYCSWPCYDDAHKRTEMSEEELAAIVSAWKATQPKSNPFGS